MLLVQDEMETSPFETALFVFCYQAAAVAECGVAESDGILSNTKRERGLVVLGPPTVSGVSRRLSGQPASPLYHGTIGTYSITLHNAVYPDFCRISLTQIVCYV